MALISFLSIFAKIWIPQKPVFVEDTVSAVLFKELPP